MVSADKMYVRTSARTKSDALESRCFVCIGLSRISGLSVFEQEIVHLSWHSVDPSYTGNTAGRKARY